MRRRFGRAAVIAIRWRIPFTSATTDADAAIGMSLLTPLIERCAAVGARQVVAVIGDSQNAGSIALHAKAGYAHAGTVKAVGFKLGRWVDIVFMQRALNGGDSFDAGGAGRLAPDLKAGTKKGPRGGCQAAQVKGGNAQEGLRSKAGALLRCTNMPSLRE